jgi:hypothetical protein
MKTLTIKNTVNEPLTGGHKTAKPVQTPVSTLTSLPAAVSHIQSKSLCACDGGCPRCSGVIQPKLTIGQPDDKYEEEADQVADQVMRMPEPKGSLVNGQSPLVQRKTGCSSCGEMDEEEPIQTKPIGDRITPLVQRQVDEEEEEVQPKLNGNDKIQRQVDEEPDEEEEEPAQLKALSNKSPPSPVGPGLQASVQSLKGGGKPLSAASRAFFEPRFGRDFSGVRVHHDPQAAKAAQAVNAQAFTMGRNVVFGAGKYSPATAAGKRLLAHELTHVMQQAHTGRRLLQRKAKPPQKAGKKNLRQVILPAKPRGNDKVRGIVHRWFEACPCRRIDYKLSGIFYNPALGNLAIAYRVCQGNAMVDFYTRLQSNAQAFLKGKAPPVGTARVGINVVLQGRRVGTKIVVEAIGTNRVPSGAVGGRAQVIFQGGKWRIILGSEFLRRLRNLPGQGTPNQLEISLGVQFGNLRFQVQLIDLLSQRRRQGIIFSFSWTKREKEPKCYHCFCPPAVRKYECIEDTLPRDEKIKEKVPVEYKKQYRYYFKYDKDHPAEEKSLRKRSADNLSALAADVKTGGIVDDIFGYASPEGDERNHNQDLSRRRAKKMKQLIRDSLNRAGLGKGVILPKPIGMGELLGRTPTIKPTSSLADIVTPGEIPQMAEKQILVGNEIGNKELRMEFIKLFKKLKTPKERLALFGLTEKDPLAKGVLKKIKRFMRSRRRTHRPWERIFRHLRIGVAIVKKVKMEERFKTVRHRGDIKIISVSDPRCKAYIKEAEKTGKFGKAHPNVLKPSASAADNYTDCLKKPTPDDLKKGCKYKLPKNYPRHLRGPSFARRRLP